MKHRLDEQTAEWAEKWQKPHIEGVMVIGIKSTSSVLHGPILGPVAHLH